MYGKFGLPDDDRPWTEYFEGNSDFSNSVSPSIFDKNIIRTRTPRERDLSEGLEDMELIQQVNIKIKETKTTTSIEDNVSNSSEIYSLPIYIKYNIVETNEGYFIENIRNKERQFLIGLTGRRSISIKLMKNNNQTKGLTIISSFNRNSKPSINDRIIGYIYRDGRIIRFENMTHDKSIIVRI